MERLIKEARELAEQGVKELILVAQETTRLWKRSVWRKMSSQACGRVMQDCGNPLDPNFVLLSGGNYR